MDAALSGQYITELFSIYPLLVVHDHPMTAFQRGHIAFIHHCGAPTGSTISVYSSHMLIFPPQISSFSVGVDVPIPTLPVGVIFTLDDPSVIRDKLVVGQTAPTSYWSYGAVE
jgi:hypothetical protein